MLKRDHLFVPGKLAYVKGDRPKVDCILCSVIRREEAVERLEVYREDSFIVMVNLYPYNPGHVMIVPIRHICDPRDLTGEEAAHLHVLQTRCLNILEKEYNPHGFNIGYNLSPFGGASIEHLHLHIVPRYKNELGFLDIIAGARTFVAEPRAMAERIARAFMESK